MNQQNSSHAEIEKEMWDQYFAESLSGKGQEHSNHLWWEIVDRDACMIAKNSLNGKEGVNVLEAGCGSGGTIFYLGNYLDLNFIYLTDISSQALLFAKSIEPSSINGNVKYIEQNIFQLKVACQFDLVLNVGLIAHYSPKEIDLLVRKTC